MSMPTNCPIPENEPQRLQAVRSYEILDTQPELEFDALTRVVSHTFDAPIAVVAMMDADRATSCKDCAGTRSVPNFRSRDAMIKHGLGLLASVPRTFRSFEKAQKILARGRLVGVTVFRNQ
jgi:hypothetical protein